MLILRKERTMISPEQQKILELTFAKDHLERGLAFLVKCESVVADEVNDNIRELKAQIIELQKSALKKAA